MRIKNSSITNDKTIIDSQGTIISNNNNNNNNHLNDTSATTNNNNHISVECETNFEKNHMHYQHEEMNRWGVPTQSVQPSAANTNSIVTTTTSLTTKSTSVTSSSSSSSVASTAGAGGGDPHNENAGSGGNDGGTTNNPSNIINSSTTTSSSESPTDSENNNQPANKHLHHQSSFVTGGHHHHQVSTAVGKTNSSPLNSNVNNTISAAADSSDNNQSTSSSSISHVQSIGNGPIASGLHSSIVQSDHHHHHHHHHSQINSQIYANTNSYLPQEMHPYPAYMHSYDQFYHPPPGMEYAQSSLYAGNQMSATVTPHHQEYKLVPSSRYHPYLNNSNNNNNNSSLSQLHHQHQLPHNTTPSNGNNTSSSVSNSSLSPRVVSSSSPTHNTMLGQTAGQETSSITQMAPGQPTPSPSPKQCDKCGMVCQTDIQLNEHYSTAHGVQTSNDIISRSGGSENDLQSQYSYQPFIKEEPGSDILDLDSQKMVYPPQNDPSAQDQPLPSMHPMHSMHRPIMWGPEMHSGYIPHSQVDSKQPYYPSIKQQYQPVKQEYGPPIKQDYPSTGGFGGNQIIKSEYNQSITQTNRSDISKFQTDIAVSNPVSSSPSEFPSTTTPQDNGPQFKGFEPPTSSLSSNSTSMKSTTWKSNEARRPKTYNCTACNKWFTSSGHLKRHYNTTLHKNAVKSSGQPDPATLPISAHHHPARDPNSKYHRNKQLSQQQPPPAPPEPPRSPEYGSQYTPPPGGFSQPQNFQQHTLHYTANGHPNGQAGPSVHASQPRGLLIISTTEAVCNNLEQEEQVQLNHQPAQIREDQYHQVILEPVSSHHNVVTTQQLQQQQQQQQQPQQVHIISMYPHQQRQDIQSIIPTTTTTTHNTMDQQRYIISPLAINTTPITSTTIPSFHHLQHQVEPLQNYHTIIGNETQMLTDSTQNILDINTFNLDSQQQSDEISQFGNSSIIQIHRIGSTPSDLENTNHPFAPVVPESLIRCFPSNCERSPQEADVAPLQSTILQPMPSYPYSPTISSTVPSTTLPALPSSTAISETVQTQAKKSTVRRKRGTNTKQLQIKNAVKDHQTITDEGTAMKETTNIGTTTSPPKIECIECGKEFAKTCYLTQHNKTFHSGEQPYRCPKCGKRFHSEDIFNTHLDKHKAKDKPFKCDKCPKQFHHKTDLRRHRDGHTGYRAHVCDTCSKGFCRKDHLRKHSDTHKPKPNKLQITTTTNHTNKNKTTKNTTIDYTTSQNVTEQFIVPDLIIKMEKN